MVQYRRAKCVVWRGRKGGEVRKFFLIMSIGLAFGSVALPSASAGAASISNEIEMRKRWGDLLEMVGTSYFQYNAAAVSSSPQFTFGYEWQVPGEILRGYWQVAGGPKQYNAVLEWDAAARRFSTKNMAGEIVGYGLAEADGSTLLVQGEHRNRFRALPDGSVENVWKGPAALGSGTLLYFPDTSRGRELAAGVESRERQRIAAEEAAAAARHQAAQEQAAQRRSAQFAAVLGGLRQGVEEAQRDSAEADARQAAMLEGIRQQAMETERRREEARRREMQAASSSAQQSSPSTGSMAATSSAPEPTGVQRPVPQTNETPRTPLAKPKPAATPTSCKVVTKRFTDRSLPMDTRAQAEAFLRFNQCKPGTGTRESLSCSTDEDPVMQKDKDGVPRIVGRKTFHLCEMTYSCPVEVCESQSAGASKH